MNIHFSVIMPTYNQSGFIRNAIRSLMAQTFTNWELIIVNDGSTDQTEAFINDYLQDDRIRYVRNETNQGLGAAVNQALKMSRYEYIAYLPSDDFYFSNHLEVLSRQFEQHPDACLVYTRMKSELCDSLLNTKNYAINGLPIMECLQMVQTAHRKTDDLWVEREEYVCSDLYKTFWYKLIGRGPFVYADEETCNWTIHASQRHKIMDEAYGGNINRYRQYYHVMTPIRMKVSERKFVDEERQFAAFRRPCRVASDGLKILIVGELSYNPERIYAFQEAGHKLYGLWTPHPRFAFTNVGHLPFGDIEDLDMEHWREEIKRIQPDIIYGLLNFAAVDFAHQVLKACPDIPFVWHFKEGPFLCFEHGLWQKLIDLFTLSDGQIYLNKDAKAWYEQYIPKSKNWMILDGDLPKREYFEGPFTEKLSAKDGEIHTVVSGRMIGMSDELIKTLAQNKIHIHLYTESYESCIAEQLRAYQKMAEGYFHLHSHCSAPNWVREYSRYDAGWLHCMHSNNHGDYSKMGWNDLNIPARVSTMMAAGLPCIQCDNSEHIVAMQTCLRDIDCGIFFKEADDLVAQLHDADLMQRLQQNVMHHRMSFAFDEHVPQIISFFRDVIKNKNERQR